MYTLLPSDWSSSDFSLLSFPKMCLPPGITASLYKEAHASNAWLQYESGDAENFQNK